MLDALHTLVCEVEQDRSLERPEQLRERIRAMDRLEDLMWYAPKGDTPGADALRQRARTRHASLAQVQQRLCDAIRQAVMQGAGAHALRGWLQRDDLAGGWGYDHLDALLSGVLALEEPHSELLAPEAEMVFYQPTPARHVLDLVEQARLSREDVLVDLGSGLGHVPLLAAICSGAQAIGIELEPAYVDSARRAAQALRLERVRFEARDVREADFSTGTLFYLYTPFTGQMMQQVLDRLAEEARRRPLRLATLGPCTAAVASQPWLHAEGQVASDSVCLFRSRGAYATA